MKKLPLLSLSKLMAALVFMPMVLAACSFNTHLRSGEYGGDAYVTGFHDGRHSGLAKAGASAESVIKDVTRFAEQPEYREGWLAGEQEGIRIRKEASAGKEVVSKGKARKESDEAPANNKAINPDLLPDMQPSKLKF